MKRLMIVMMVTLSIMAHAFWNTDMSELDTYQGLIYKGNKPFTGTAENIDREGKLVTGIKNGKQHGKHQVWYSNGQKREFTTYKNGKINGKFEEWYSNGQKKSVRKLVDGTLEGVSKSWHENGKLKGTLTIKNGIRIGKAQSWYDNGNIEYEVTYDKNGDMHGLEKRWYKNGNQKSIVTMINGYENGMAIKYYENGNIKSKGILKGDTKVGDWEFEYENGSAKNATYDSLGRKHGSVAEYNESGIMISYTEYKSGVRHGESSTSFDSGNRKTSTEYVDGQIHGEFSRYSETQYKPTSVETYDHGKYTGKVINLTNFKHITFDRQGDITEIKEVDENENVILHVTKLPNFGGYDSNEFKYTSNGNVSEITVTHYKKCSYYPYDGIIYGSISYIINMTMFADGETIAKETGVVGDYSTDWLNGIGNSDYRKYNTEFYNNGNLKSFVGTTRGNRINKYSYREDGTMKMSKKTKNTGGRYEETECVLYDATGEIEVESYRLDSDGVRI